MSLELEVAVAETRDATATMQRMTAMREVKRIFILGFGLFDLMLISFV